MVENTLALQVKSPQFDAATPLLTAARIREADTASRMNEMKLRQSAIGAEARGLVPFVGRPEFAQRWGEAVDRLQQQGHIDANSAAQWRSSPSPLVLRQIIAQTQAEGQEPEAVRTVRAAGLNPSSEEGRAALFPRQDTKVESIFDEDTGQERKVIVRPGGRTIPIGGTKKPTLDPIDKEQAKKDVGRVELYKTEGDQARTMLADIAQLRELRKGVGYEGGIMADRRADIAGWFGYGQGQAIRSKATDIQLGLSEKTKGAITDREQAMFKGATPGLEMTDDAAEQVFAGQEAAARRTVERGKFFETWFRNNKSLSGAQEAWDRFIKEKPILDSDGKGGIKVNQQHIDAWKPYVTKGDSDAPAKSPMNVLDQARDAIARGAPREAVIMRLRQNGIDPSGL